MGGVTGSSRICVLKITEIKGDKRFPPPPNTCPPTPSQPHPNPSPYSLDRQKQRGFFLEILLPFQDRPSSRRRRPWHEGKATRTTGRKCPLPVQPPLLPHGAERHISGTPRKPRLPIPRTTVLQRQGEASSTLPKTSHKLPGHSLLEEARTVALHKRWTRKFRTLTAPETTQPACVSSNSMSRLVSMKY